MPRLSTVTKWGCWQKTPCTSIIRHLVCSLHLTIRRRGNGVWTLAAGLRQLKVNFSGWNSDDIPVAQGSSSPKLFPGWVPRECALLLCDDNRGLIAPFPCPWTSNTRYFRDGQDFTVLFCFDVFFYFNSYRFLHGNGGIHKELSRRSGWKKQRVEVKATSKTCIMMEEIMWKFCDVPSLLIEAAISSSISFYRNNAWCKLVIGMSIKHIDVWCLNDWLACWHYKKFISRHA